MHSINNGFDSTKLAEAPFFHCGPCGSSCVFHYSYNFLRNVETLAKWSLLEARLLLQLMQEFKICSNTAQKMKFSIKDFFSKCDQIRSFLRI